MRQWVIARAPHIPIGLGRKDRIAVMHVPVLMRKRFDTTADIHMFMEEEPDGEGNPMPVLHRGP
jgi:hypothetical protein